jgi:hypothetical protein
MASKRAKLIAERDRQRKREETAREEAELAANYKRLQGLRGGFARRVEKVEVVGEIRKDIKRKQKTLEQHVQFGTRFKVEARLPAKVDPAPEHKELSKKLSPEMEKREEAAQERYKEMKSQVVPAYNKGGLQYLYGQDWIDFQKGLNRRRS